MAFATYSPRGSGSCRIVLTVALASLIALTVVGCKRQPKQADLRPGTITGRVTSASGRVIPTARISVDRETSGGPSSSGKATVTAKGDFSVPHLAPGRYILKGEAPGYASVAVALELAPGESVKTALRLESAQQLVGRVVDSRGKPLPDALVLAWPAGAPKRTIVEGRSDGAGRFALEGVARGTYTLLAEAPGFGTLQLDRVEIPATNLTLTLEGQSRSIGGIVADENGKAQSGATVLLGSPNLRAPREVVTDEKGTFMFHGLGYGKFTLRASHAKRASLPVTQFIEEGLGWLPPFSLTLAPAAFAEGRVVDDRGQPLIGARVEVTGVPADDLPLTGSTDRRGRFSIGPLSPGKYQVLARLPDYAIAELAEVRLRSDVASSLELRAARGARLHGRVLDEAARPLAGATISAIALVDGQDELTVVAGALPRAAEAALLPAHRLARRGKVSTATTDDRGRFLLDDLPPGRLRLEVTQGDKLPYRRDEVSLAPGGTQALGDLVLHAGVLLSGRVLDERGRPIAGAQVEARRTGRALGSTSRVVSDQGGQFAVRVPAGDYSVVAHAPERVPQSVFSLRAEPGVVLQPLEFRLPRADAALDGHVREASGRPVKGATVVVLEAPPGLDAEPGTPWQPRSAATAVAPLLGTTVTDAGGRFRIGGLPRASLIAETRHPDWPVVAMVARPGARVSITLAQPGGIEGEVRESGSGAFVTGYELAGSGPEGRTADRVRTIGAGFEILGLVPGRWTLKVSAPGYRPTEQAIEVSPGASRKEPSVRGVRIELSRADASDAGPPP